ncbi:MAG TPA: hypothetical protein VGM72_07570, partial [Micropepsaceae bacterium]
KPCCLFYTTSLSGGVETWSSRIDIADYGLGSDGLGTWFYSSLMYVANNTELHFVATKAKSDNSIRQDVHYFIYDTTDGSLKNFDKSFSTAAGSLPVLIADLDAHYRIFAQPTAGGSTGIPKFLFDAAGRANVLTIDGTPGSGDFDVWHLILQSGSWTDTMIGNTNSEVNDYALIPAVAGGVTAYFPQAATAGFAVDGDYYTTTRDASTGTWSPVELFLASDGINALAVGLPVLNGIAALRFVFSEIHQSSADSGAGGLRKYAYGDFGYVTARSAPMAVNATYNRRLTITTHPASTLTNFPVRVSITDAALKTIANGGHVQNSNGYDIVFAADNAYVTPYAWQMESYDGTAGTVDAWVQIPSVSSSVDTVFYMLYGDATIATFQSTSVAVWDSHYKGVYHLSVGLNANDSTAGANNGTNNGATAVAAKIAGGAAFNGTSQYIDLGNNANLKIALPATISMWINHNASYNPATNWDWFSNDVVWGGSGNRHGIDIGDDNTGKVVASFSDGTSNYSLKIGTTTLSKGVDYFVTCVIRAHNDITIYLNGVDDGGSYAGAGGSSVGYGTGSGAIGVSRGASAGGTNQGFYFGCIDELRVSDIERSAAWIAAEYTNQNSPGTFYTLAAENGQTFLHLRPRTSLRLALRAA